MSLIIEALNKRKAEISTNRQCIKQILDSIGSDIAKWLSDDEGDPLSWKHVTKLGGCVSENSVGLYIGPNNELFEDPKVLQSQALLWILVTYDKSTSLKVSFPYLNWENVEGNKETVVDLSYLYNFVIEEVLGSNQYISALDAVEPE